MNRQELFESMGAIDEEILERSEKNKKKKKRRAARWMIVTAAALALVVGISFLTEPKYNPIVLETLAIEQAKYPEVPQHPSLAENLVDSETGQNSEEYEQAYDEWSDWTWNNKMDLEKVESLQKFYMETMWEFVSDSQKENVVYSPLNVYMALGMLAEITGGNSRQQILDLLQAEDIESLRTQVKEVWEANYKNDGVNKNVLASSLWLNQDISFVPETMKTLAETYYASSYQGTMGSEEFNHAFQSWLNEQTDGLLEDQVQEIEMSEETLLALATTINFKAEWNEGFPEDKTTEGIFHGAAGDTSCDFMKMTLQGGYFWGEKFGAIFQGLKDSSGGMYFILPDEGVAAEELLGDPEVNEMIFGDYESINSTGAILHLSIPKFDVSSQIDLEEGLKSLGVTDVFDRSVSDFSSLTADENVPFVELSKAQHGARVAIDEKGVVAAAYTVIYLEGSAPVSEKIEFVVDRPFLFVITNRYGLPLFVGVVNQIK